MGLLGDFTKGFVIFTGLLWVLAMIGSFATGQTAIALLLLIVLTIPLSMIAWEYLKNRKKNNMPTN
jgi:membrane protein implicated in regulation of membrane protease activity